MHGRGVLSNSTREGYNDGALEAETKANRPVVGPQGWAGKKKDPGHEARSKKEEGRRKKEEGRRKKEEES